MRKKSILSCFLRILAFPCFAYPLLLVGVAMFCFITMAPIRNGTSYSLVTTPFNAISINGAAVGTSTAIEIGDSEYFGVQYFATGTAPDLTLTYDLSGDGTNWQNSIGTITTTYTSGNVVASVNPPVAPIIRFRYTGNAGNGTNTALTLKFMRQ